MSRFIYILYASFIYLALNPDPDHKSNSQRLLYPELVNKFYEARNNTLFWFATDTSAVTTRLKLKQYIDSSFTIGTDKNRYHFDAINKSVHLSYSPKDSTMAFTIDKIYSDAAITLCEDLYRGYGISKWISSDQVSAVHENDDNNFLLRQLSDVRSGSDLEQLFYSLSPNDTEYATIKGELHPREKALTVFQKKEILISLNLYRWVHHFRFKKWIVVNIASATLRYYEGDSLKLRMKVIVGKPSTRTPRFAAYCNQVILYPYWNVPQSITLKELLPDFKKDPSLIDELNMQLFDPNGNIVDQYTLNWKEYNRNYFPFRVRQSTGCDNSLGVIKFNLTSPFSVYMHDTNAKNLFLAEKRFFSHGCIRLEQPIALANYLLPNVIDSNFLAACMKNETPQTFPFPDQVPVFVIYQPVEAPGGQLQFFKDIYRLFD